MVNDMNKQTFIEQKAQNLPNFDALPLIDGLPKGCSWDLWDCDGVKDEFGTLNLLTSSVVSSAAAEIKDGISVSLNWSLSKPNVPVFGRQALCHTIIDNEEKGSKSLDDCVSFNTQSSSQWDSLRHVIHTQSGLLYNGFSKASVLNTSIDCDRPLGIDKWHKRGGIVGRGILIDYVAYAARHDIPYSPVEYHAISLAELKQAAKEQGVTPRQGDILLVRSGLIKWYNECSDEATRDAYFSNPTKAGVGVAPNQDTIEWVWNTHFAAVAGDALAWEPIPYPKDTPSFHQYLLAMWGTPIGELWDLEMLAETCEKLGRYSFFLTSIPLNVPGGVASPPNAVAVF